jgi:hypothetical protein
MLHGMSMALAFIARSGRWKAPQAIQEERQ